MSLLQPDIRTSKKFSDEIKEGERFFLTGIRTVEVNTEDFGKGEMVLLKVHGHEEELGIWGQYLVEQARNASGDDLNKWYTITRKVVDGYSKRPVKALTPPDNPADAESPL